MELLEAKKWDAELLAQQGRTGMSRMGSDNDPHNNLGSSYKKGYEIHPNESHTINAPENNIPHVKWKD
jgi:hypothetical protein